ncbi:DUF1616 domain-containing protein [Natronoarchaeum rubrum]|uniref:DUF1616 domain-containing protein n=1 Tax=Natronoarchaeum rubrum TaxID=755311 RepID=UPI002112411A|nr:DUF1616 domain-containing protein [Natronoarchaeum rubrum]
MLGTAVRSTLDVVCAVLFAILATAAILRGDPGTPLRIVLGLPLVLFVPGYVLIAALYPERHSGASVSDESPISRPKETIDGLPTATRLGLSLAGSLAIVPTVAFVANFAVGGVGLRPVLLGTVGIVVISGLVAIVARVRLPPDGRYRPLSGASVRSALDRYYRRGTDGMIGNRPFEAGSRRGVILNVVLAASVLVLLSSVAVGFAVHDGDEFTEFYLTTETGDGEYAAASTDAFASGDAPTLHPTVTNQEGGARAYTVVALHQEVDRTESGTTVVDETELDRFSLSADAGETARVAHDVDPPATGSEHRIVYLLYVGDAPDDPSREGAYRYVQLWTGDGGQQQLDAGGELRLDAGGR